MIHDKGDKNIHTRKIGEIPRWRLREEAESMPPKVKFWRDTGDTPCRQNHQEEAKL
jgi:hypothetical protein